MMSSEDIMESSWFRYYVPEFRYSGIVELNPKDPYRQAAKAITNECHGLHRLQLFLVRRSVESCYMNR